MQPFYQMSSYGLDAGTAIGHARQVALTHAIRVAAIAGATWPNSEENYIRAVSQELINELIAFSIHARRFLEITNSRNQILEGSLHIFLPAARDCEYETSLWSAVNKIVHSRTIEIVAVERETVVFTNFGDRKIMHARVQSDKGEAVLICPTALVHAYLAVET